MIQDLKNDFKNDLFDTNILIIIKKIIIILLIIIIIIIRELRALVMAARVL